ncbi:hypothetical protein BpHYR1_013788 [Brachionus plicatilis]|uniref:Uncharacterized protein n=1 Tax=Brachionus plicatilis TaxID=10195 RepID=A0A3M7S7R4_BRAPC|nr:hypothetical protein BpHYR1_013788 [Brachionus plicatilis]
MDGITLLKNVGAILNVPPQYQSPFYILSALLQELVQSQSAVKKVLSKHKNPIACPECGKLIHKTMLYSVSYYV